MKEKGFSLADYQEAFREAGVESQYETGLTRLCSGMPRKNDEGYIHLLPEPPSIQVMKDFFIHERDLFEVQKAKEAADKR
jgi:hypothetical protein